MDDIISKLSEIRSGYNCFDKDDEPFYRALSEAIRILSKRADGDTISRSAAINEIRKCRFVVDAIEKMRALPSAQTEHSEGLYVDGYNDGYRDGIKDAQPETAKRIVGKSRDGMTLWYQCDMCNEPVDAQDEFCRGCGRRLTNG